MDNLTFRTGRAADVANAQHVNLAAFAPIHESFAEILGTKINALVYPDWQASQRHDLDEAIAKPNCSWIVAELEHRIVGFVVVEADRETEVGELQLIAVHPELQGRGIGALLNEYALDLLRGEGMRLVTLGTGGDPSHAAARRSYERAGYTGLPLVRYYRTL